MVALDLASGRLGRLANPEPYSDPRTPSGPRASGFAALHRRIRASYKHTGGMVGTAAPRALDRTYIRLFCRWKPKSTLLGSENKSTLPPVRQVAQAPPTQRRNQLY